MKNIKQTIARVFAVVTVVITANLFALSGNIVHADANCAYNICPKNTAIIFEGKVAGLNDVQLLAVTGSFAGGIILLINGKRIKTTLAN